MSRHATRSRALPRTYLRRRRQRGNAAIEFALVFPVFFLILYAIVTYSMVFLVQQSLTAAAGEGARAALAYRSNTDPLAALNDRASQACLRALAVVSWLPGAGSATGGPTSCTPAVNMAPAGCTNNASMDCIQITLSYAYANKPLVPTLPLLDIAIPPSLTGQATVQIDPENLL
ncbi:TadE family protein [Paraburkholderia acidisoli]|uniref:Pilus assembly protein n=1 Tax=Paraburkholderia acidisoli TaxID=2571748 RepID=A0A7Z2GH29_9BURK|nr:TadE/TadG family type IV pilus assembly protein [Paraburkholderia acidisoli]QGZ61698.1 pilus assembly protein [Paraburkholderia acidisoli]